MSQNINSKKTPGKVTNILANYSTTQNNINNRKHEGGDEECFFALTL